MATQMPAQHAATTTPSAVSAQHVALMTPEDEELAALPWMIRLTITTLVATVLGWIIEDATGLPQFVSWALYLTAYATGGFYSVQEAWATLRRRQFDVNFLMIIAAVGAAIVGQPREGAVLMFLFSLSNTLETYAMGRTHASVRALLDMTPKTARVLRTLPSGVVEEIEVPVEQAGVGELVQVRPGEQIPTDGVITQGESAVNEASITGESMPVEKHPGMKVFAGTFNSQGALTIRVSTAVQDSTLARIVQVVREAREQKAQSQDFTDRVIGQYYAYAVVVMTLLAIAIPLLFLGWDFQRTLYRAMTLMVVASPCALVISIPAALLSALACGARNGVLFKGGAHLESAARIKVVAFDKTGTLTTGRPGVVAVQPFTPDASALAEPVPADDHELTTLTPKQVEVLALASAIERLSEHPLAMAIVKGAKERDVEIPDAINFTAMTGAGARAQVGGRDLRIGRPKLFAPLAPAIAAQITAQEQLGRTVVLVGGERPLGLIAIADTVRPEAAAAVAELKRIGITHVVLLTGDNRHVAENLARELGVDEVRAELLPEQKVEVIRDLQQRFGPVAMIGDGINDAPALATAELGVAMGAAGTDVALESADVLLMGDDLSKLAGALELARRARRIVYQNLAFASLVIITLIISSIGGFILLPMGVVGHEGSTLIVVVNGLRLLVGGRWSR